MFIDLRSDTVTRPDAAMRRAMAEAEVGDDCFGEDPTVNRLQTKAARMLGKPAALFTPSGTMANQIALRTHTRPGDEVICEARAHIYRHEAGAGAALSGLSYFPLPGDKGRLSAEQVASAVRLGNEHWPVSRVVTLENTHNRGMGAAYDLDAIDAIAVVARENGLALHLDGARMFHACLVKGYAPAELAARFDTISFCLSKGLGAPVGAMLVSSEETIEYAVRVRKQFGGGMRQVGILAAAGLYALEHNIDRLADDHANAARLARGLAAMSKVKLDPADTVSNIVIFDISATGRTPDEIMGQLMEVGVGTIPFGPTELRAVTHLDVDAAGVEAALTAMARVLD